MSNLQTQAVNFIRFHGLTLLVVEHEGVEYVPARPLSELAGTVWRMTKRTLSQPDNAHLYGTKALYPPEIDGKLHTGMQQTQVFLRLDRSRMFLARVSTANMRAKGAVEAADALLALQIEWAEALHAYETHGVAIKKGHREARAELVALIKARGGSPTPAERATLTTMIADVLRELGHELPPDPQISLPGVA